MEEENNIKIELEQLKMQKNEKNVTFITNVKESIKETFSMSTIHALPNILANKWWPVKIMWIICFLGMLGVCIWLIYQSVDSYNQHEGIL